jgi:hypothetical protein
MALLAPEPIASARSASQAVSTACLRAGSTGFSGIGMDGQKRVVSVRSPYYYPLPDCWFQRIHRMKTWKSEHDLLLDQTLALVNAAIDDEAKAFWPLTESSSEARGHSLRPILGAEIAVEKTTQTDQDLLVENTLSLIEHVADGEPKATGLAQRLKVVDEISRMSSDLNTLRKRVASFKEAQQRFQREREEYLRDHHGKSPRPTQWNPPKP